MHLFLLRTLMLTILSAVCISVFGNTVTIKNPDGTPMASCNYGADGVKINGANVVYTCLAPAPPPPPANCLSTSFKTFPDKGQPQFPVIPHGSFVSFKVPADSGTLAVTQYASTPNSASIEFFYSRCPGVKDDISTQSVTNAYKATRQPCMGYRGYTGDAGLLFAPPPGTVTACPLPAGTFYFTVRNRSAASPDTCPNLPNTATGCTVVVQWMN